MSAVQTAAPARPQAGCEQPLQAASPTSSQLPSPNNGFPPPAEARTQRGQVWESSKHEQGKWQGPEDVKRCKWSLCLQAALAS